jgi:hypothetical protein
MRSRGFLGGVIPLLMLGFSPKMAGAQQPELAQTFLKVGQPAPDFTLLDNHWKKHRLSDYRGKTVVLAFYVLAFTSG